MRIRDEAALDPYLFVHEGRKHMIYNGNPPSESYDYSLHENIVHNEFAAKPLR